jgi:hypothetical protein
MLEKQDESTNESNLPTKSRIYHFGRENSALSPSIETGMCRLNSVPSLAALKSKTTQVQRTLCCCLVRLRQRKRPLITRRGKGRGAREKKSPAKDMRLIEEACTHTARTTRGCVHCTWLDRPHTRAYACTSERSIRVFPPAGYVCAPPLASPAVWKPKARFPPIDDGFSGSSTAHTVANEGCVYSTRGKSLIRSFIVCLQGR